MINTAVAEGMRKLFSVFEEGLTPRDVEASMLGARCLPTRMLAARTSFPHVSPIPCSCFTFLASSDLETSPLGVARWHWSQPAPDGAFVANRVSSRR